MTKPSLFAAVRCGRGSAEEEKKKKLSNADNVHALLSSIPRG